MELDEVMRVLEAERRRRGMTLDEVARRARWANESIPRRLERPGSNPTLRSVQRYSEAVGVDLSISVVGTRYVSFFNHAGGIGKTSLVRDVGYVLGSMGFKVLLIDVDPQANLTHWMGAREVPLKGTLQPAVMEEGQRFPEPLEVHGVHLVPSTLELAGLEAQLVGKIMGVTRLRAAARSLPGYDFVLLDPPPSLGQLSALAVIASNYVVVPVPTDIKGLESVPTVRGMVKEYRQAAPDLDVAMFVPTMHDARTRHHQEALEEIKDRYAKDAPVASPLAYRPAVYRDAALASEPVAVGAPGSKADEELRTVAGELLQAVGVRVDV